ncbi:MAG: hypothetical protein K2N49_05230 [Ruminococcus sp.]|nr:hypothetical protein [Ruminococcus sp.]MDE7226243.1 hypothetical protein [Ruminococcus sp.]
MIKKIIVFIIESVFCFFMMLMPDINIFCTEDSDDIFQCASNADYIMYADRNTGNISIENRKTGYIWSSVPDSEQTDISGGIISSNIIKYGIPEKYSVNNVLRSGTDDCEISVEQITDGVRVNYNYKKTGFEFPVEYILESNRMRARLKVNQIRETNPENKAMEISILPDFGSASDNEDGYFVIPDGSGAIIRFNSSKGETADSYSQLVYGRDITAVPAKNSTVTKQIYLPVYGIVKQDNAMLVIAEKGDANSYISASVSGQSGSGYNKCGFTFVLRGSDTYYMSGKNSSKVTIIEDGEIDSGDIELLYYPIYGKNPDYIDVAECYRNYLLNEKNIPVRTEKNKSDIYINVYGGVRKKKTVMGIPVASEYPVTKYSEVIEMLQELKSNGINDIVLSYNNWTDDGIENKIDTSAVPSEILGGKPDFRRLLDFMQENKIGFYPVADNNIFTSGNGYNSLRDTCIRISGAYSRIVSYDLAYGIPDKLSGNMSLLSPECYDRTYQKITGNYPANDISGICTGTLTSSLYGDYGKRKISRNDAENIITENLVQMSEQLDILADSANAYVLPYVSHITDVPLGSGRFDIFDEDIPFYQIVMHGIIPYSSTPVNADSDPELFMLKSVSAGSLLNYDMIYSETGELKDTEFDILYYADYRNWIDSASVYNNLKILYDTVADSTITGYNVENSVAVTEYSDGTEVEVDFENRTVKFGKSGNMSTVYKGK